MPGAAPSSGREARVEAVGLALEGRPGEQVGADFEANGALFGGQLLSLTGYIIHTAILTVICLAAYRMTQARKMVKQYPWLYERSGLFSWRERSSAA